MIKYIIILFIFLFCSSLFLYKITNKLFKNIIKILNKNKCPTVNGVLIHSIIFFILFRFFLQFNNIKENIDLETTEIDSDPDKSLNHEHSHKVKIGNKKRIYDLINETSMIDLSVNEFLEDLNNNNYDLLLNYEGNKKDKLTQLSDNVFNNSDMWDVNDNSLQKNWDSIKEHKLKDITSELNKFNSISKKDIKNILSKRDKTEEEKEELESEIDDLKDEIDELNDSSKKNNFRFGGRLRGWRSGRFKF